VQEDGFEAGILACDRADWIRHAAGADEAWTRAEMQRACERYEAIFGAPALTRGAPGWQMSRHAYRYTQRLGFRHCSDARGTGPFIPVVNGEIIACPQVPTTLPTFDELLARGLGPDEAVQQLLALSCEASTAGHVYSLHAEVEGGPFEPVMRALLSAWRDAGISILSLRDYAAGLDLAHLPRRVVVEQAVPGCSRGTASAQGKEFLT
jgi:undecaprenyl phosphate-alpha-L-ara4FN deformylase